MNVYTSGCFDLLHASHVDLLQRSARLGDRLVVFLNKDSSIQKLKGPSRPIIPYEERKFMLENLRSVDEVVGFEDCYPGDALKGYIAATGGLHRPFFYVKGCDRLDDFHASHDTPERFPIRGTVESLGGQIILIGNRFDTHTSTIIERLTKTVGNLPDSVI